MLREDLPTPGGGGAVAPVMELPTLAGVSSIVESPPPPTLMDLVITLAGADDPEDDDFDPEKLVGDLKAKVDACHFKIVQWEAKAAYFSTMASKIAGPLASKAGAFLNRKKRLRDFVTNCLLTERSCRVETGVVEPSSSISLPGNAFKVRLRDSNPSLDMTRKADVEDFERWPDLVVQNRSYDWDEPKIKELAKKGELPEGIPAKLTVGHYPEWVPNVPDELEAKPKKKKGKTTP